MRTAIIGMVLVMLIFGGLTLQMARGQDPALGTKVTNTATGSAPSPASAPEAGGEQDEGVVIQPPQPIQSSLPVPAPVQTSAS